MTRVSQHGQGIAAELARSHGKVIQACAHAERAGAPDKPIELLVAGCGAPDYGLRSPGNVDEPREMGQSGIRNRVQGRGDSLNTRRVQGNERARRCVA